MRITHLLGMVALVGLAACSGSDGPRPLHNLKSYNGQPEEFSIAPAKPLVQPENYSELPSPTPGGANRTDQNPKADVIAALGGNPERLNTGGGIPASDAALVNRASRYGRDGAIRQQLATEDRDWRKTRSRFTWSIVPKDDYFHVYRKQALEPYSWLNRYRAAGAVTPTAPPAAQ